MTGFVQSLAKSCLYDLKTGVTRQRAADPEPPVSLRSTTTSRGTVLLCYLRDHIGLQWDDDRLSDGHPNKWDSWLIADTLTRLGWDVDVIDWDDHDFQPERHYDAVIALDWNGKRIVDAATGATPRLLLHLTTAFPAYNNQAEQTRLRALEQRRGVRLKQRRHLANETLSGLAIADADACSLIGNAWTFGTYPTEVRSKLSLLPVTAPVDKFGTGDPVSSKPLAENTFLWFAGGGAVHKGLDLALEAIPQIDNTHLHVVGSLEAERDFLWLYRNELFREANISYHGYLPTSSPLLAEVMRESTFLIAPTCSEATSNAAVFCLLRGLIPIYSESIGISLPSNLGWEVTVPSLEAFGEAARLAMATPLEDRAKMSRLVYEYASQIFTRKAYAEQMQAFLSDALE